MEKSKLTLLVDGNWLLMSRLSVITNNYIDDNELCKNLQLLMIQSIKKVLKKFPIIDNIIFCADGGSWRNDLEIPETVKDDDGNIIRYKGNREKPSDINWELIFKAYESLMLKLKQNNINAYKEYLVEGDDLLWYWSQKLNSEGTNCIIWTKDNDLKQLVNVDSNKCFTVWWNEANGMFITKFNDDELDFLFNNDFNENDQIFKDITNNIQITKLNKNEIIIDKIIRGDKSDNIEPVLYKQTPKSTRKYRISPNDIDYTMNWKDDQVVYNYFSELLKTKKYSKNINKSLDDIIQHFKYNRNLVALDKDYYPNQIIENLNNLDYKPNENINGIYLVENEIRSDINNLNGIIDFI